MINKTAPRKQQTIQKIVKHTSIGLHLGKNITITLKPAPEDSGIVFIRTDLSDKPSIPVSVHLLTEKERRTSICSGNAEVQTVEHLLASLKALEIDNVVVEMNGAELPGSDGSAKSFVDLILEAGVVEQKAIKSSWSLSEYIRIVNNGALLVALPSSSDCLIIDYTLSYQNHNLLNGYLHYELNKESFIREIAPARTFVLEEEAKMLQENGLGKGATTQNTLVVNHSGVIENKTRFEDEFTRHKVLDLIGDLALLPVNLNAHIIAIKSGHNLNIMLVKKLAEMIETNPQTSFCQKTKM